MHVQPHQCLAVRGSSLRRLTGAAFVASFIGAPAMNLFDAMVDQDGLRLAGASLRLGDAQRRAVQGQERVVAGIRPQHLSAGDGELELKVALVEDAGDDAYIYGQLAGDPGSNVIVAAGPIRPQPGELIRAGADPGHVHLFDAASGERIGDG